jgi:hypothetical protein
MQNITTPGEIESSNTAHKTPKITPPTKKIIASKQTTINPIITIATYLFAEKSAQIILKLFQTDHYA